jgi:hypothetical protein
MKLNKVGWPLFDRKVEYPRFKKEWWDSCEFLP